MPFHTFIPSDRLSIHSPEERSDELQQLGSGDDLLVEQGDAAQEVLVHFLALKQAADLEARARGETSSVKVVKT